MQYIITTLRELDSLLVEAVSWLEHDAEHFVAMKLLGGNMPEFSLVPHSLMAQKHPDFPRALLGLIAYSFEKDRETSGAYGNLAFDTLDVLEKGTVSLLDIDGKPRSFYEISELKTVGPHKKIVSIEAAFVDLAFTQEGVTFVTNRDLRRLLFSAMEMQTRFPGWEKRWTIGKELGMENTELLQHVFAKSTAQANTSAITDIIFE